MTEKTQHSKKDTQEKENIFKKIIKERAPKSDDTQIDENEKLVQENDELKKKFLYLAAEKENLKKTLEKEVENARDFAISKFARDILSSVENLEKAISHIDTDQLKDNSIKSIFDGVNLTLNEIFSTLKRNGISKIEAKGKIFDHNLHQAIKTVGDEKLDNNTIKEVLQDGYIINGRLLRPAVVVVVSNE
jgi:molecular chaperone GrpE